MTAAQSKPRDLQYAGNIAISVPRRTAESNNGNVWENEYVSAQSTNVRYMFVTDSNERRSDTSPIFGM
ncbi:hypothetical protein DF200_01515 [Bifidobacterium catulorum]|uniref:Uncharacterized protein n=1 Tax=Bifidobacterium catulorum TaxID=1630173 RepID=A0A2U2MUS3_9BIFI|nr:hypothetical protein DF200_01515 [Bifidobacterium catulorum]